MVGQNLSFTQKKLIVYFSEKVIRIITDSCRVLVYSSTVRGFFMLKEGDFMLHVFI